MIGNDIIDISLARKHVRSSEKKYWEKVLTKAEIHNLEKQEHPILAFHTYWAAKEASFKLVSKLYPGYPFSPKKIILQPLVALSAEYSGYTNVETIHGSFSLHLKINSQIIEVFAFENTLSRDSRAASSDPGTPGTLAGCPPPPLTCIAISDRKG